MARKGTGWGILFLGLVVAALAGCSLFETAMGPGEDSVAGEPGFVAGLEDGDLWVAQDAYAGVEALPPQGGQGPDFVPGQLIVRFRAGQYSDANVNTLATKYAVRTSGKNRSLRLALVTVPAGKSLEEMKAKLEADPKVESVGLNQVYQLADVGEGPLRPEAITNDERFFDQSALWRIGYNKIPTSAMPASAPGIAIVDTGVDYTHPDIGAAKVIKGPDYYDGDMYPMDVTGHGTHVAGIAAALTGNNRGVAGVSGKSQILAIRVGKYTIPGFSAAAGITYAADNASVKVINCSWGGDYSDQVIEAAISYAFSRGKLVVAAAGNDNSGDDHYPAAYANVLSVGATNCIQSASSWVDVKAYEIEGVQSWASNWASTVDIVAPGVSIISTIPVAFDPPFPYEWWSGTSMASPLVAGAAALVWGKWPTMTATQVRDLLVDNAATYPTGIPADPLDPISDSFDPDVGRLDLYEAFAAKGAVLTPETGAIAGWVLDAGVATDGDFFDPATPPLAGATVKATKVGTTTYKTATTRSNGSYTITDLSPGVYTLLVSKAGYCTTPGVQTWSVVAGEMRADHRATNFALPKAQASGTYTVVVQFCDPDEAHDFVDMDSCLWLPDTLELRKFYRVDWMNVGILNVHPYARLLYETFTGTSQTSILVAETTVFKGVYPGVYRFAVAESTGVYEGEDWLGLNAVVRLYDGATFKRAFLPDGHPGGVGEIYWPVFELTRPAGTIADGFPTVTGGPYSIPSDYPGPYGTAEVFGTSKRQP